ncbi:hypothetical protein [Pseudoneobacillus sp. C159]
MSGINGKLSIGKLVTLGCVSILILIYVYYHFIFLNQLLRPVSASDMTVEERNTQDARLIENILLDKFNHVKSVEVNHEISTITIYTNIFPRETRAIEITEDLKKEVKHIIRGNSSKLTFEEYYPVMVYSKEGDILGE